MRRNQIDLVIGGDGLLVIVERAVFLEIAFEHGAHLDGALELVAGIGNFIGARGRAERQHKGRRQTHGDEGRVESRLRSNGKDALHSFVNTTRPFESTSWRTGNLDEPPNDELWPEPGRKYASVTFCTYCCVSGIPGTPPL